MTDKVLVTGGAGFVGSHVADAYLEAGCEVTVLDDLSTGRRERVPTAARFVQADVRSPEARQLLATGGFTLLNHHAAQMDVRRSVADPVLDGSVNVIGLLNLLEGARAGGVRRVVFASSGGVVYGESAALPLAETAPKLPVSPYGAAKLASEYYLATFAQLYDLETAALRYSNVYGPRQNAHGEAGVVAIFSGRILRGEPLTIYGDWDQTRDMVYVKDVAGANLAASTRPLPPLTDLDARAFNVGTGIETSVNGLAAGLAAAAGRTPEIRRAPARPGELRRSVLAVDKAARRLRWLADRFMAEIERAPRLDDAYHAAMRLPPSPYNRLLREGIHFFSELKPGGLTENGPGGSGIATQGTLTTTQLEALRMVLAKEVAAERDAAARFIPWLATFGSVSPLLGLLGTVLGVMDAFIGIAVGGSGNIAAVAPGVAEALVTTVAGLAVAVPSVMAYNIFVNRLGLFAG